MVNVKAFVATVLFLLVTSSEADSGPEQSCSETKKPEVKFSITARRNATGHWLTQIGLNPGSDHTAPGNTGLWTFDLEQSDKVNCKGKDGFNIVATITGHTTKPIPVGYELFPGVGYYKFHADDVIWSRARQVCAEEGGHLVVINSENEANVVKQLFMRFPKEKLNTSSAYNSVAVGVYEQGENGQYFTIFGDTLNSTGFTRWHPGKPHLSGTDECVYLIRFTAGLEDLPCTLTSPFICEIPLV